MSKTDDDTLVTATQAARLISGVSAKTVRSWRDNGRVKAHPHPVGGTHRFRLGDLRAAREAVKLEAGCFRRLTAPEGYATALEAAHLTGIHEATIRRRCRPAAKDSLPHIRVPIGYRGARSAVFILISGLPTGCADRRVKPPEPEPVTMTPLRPIPAVLMGDEFAIRTLLERRRRWEAKVSA